MRKKQLDAIDEGVSIALAAAKLIVKNHILVDTIAGGESFEAGAFDKAAQKALGTLATESENAAKRLKKTGALARRRHSISDGTHDYRSRDVRNLRRRRKQSEGVAERLRAMAEDPEAVAKLVEDSREAAWGDVSANLQNRLRIEALRPDADPDYEKMREARMQALMMVDLQNLQALVDKRRSWAGK